MKDLFSGVVYDFIINECINNKPIWNYNGGMIDERNELNLKNSKIGVSYVTNFINQVQPKKILETGTNYGSFSYILYESLEEFELHTCDIVNESKRCIDFINENYKKDFVKFYNQDSLDFLKSKKEENFDLAWLDSKHTYEHLIEELKVVGDMGIPYILVDDFSWVQGIQFAIFDFLKEYENYKFYSYSNNNEKIGSIVILKKMDNGI